MAEIVPVPPDVARIAEGLRDTGYEFNTAVADIVDNSIAAGATSVDIRLRVDFGGQIVFSVGDDGCGMNREGLIDAMKYGSKRRADPSSLGKFGLGLKTASTAFCKRLVVVSKAPGAAAALRAAWDLDVLAASGNWGLELDEPSPEEFALLNECAPGDAGTVVIWDRIDRLLSDFKRPDGKAFKNAIKRLEASLRIHVGTVFQRFLDPGDTRARTVTIVLNGKGVEAWDPFCVQEVQKPEFEQLMMVQIPTGREVGFTLRAFILPRQEEFTSEANRVAARVSNELQGIYVYRENRLIHGPDWLGMYKQEPHLSILRIELSFTHELDDAFQVDIKKSRILLNEHLYDWMKDKFLAAPRREAQVRYRKGAAATAKGTGALLHLPSNNAIEQRVAGLQKATVTGIGGDGNVTVENNSGKTSATLRVVVPEPSTAVHVATASNLDMGVLWEGAWIAGNVGVTLNTAHPYYIKAYLPNKENTTLIQALDFLLWSLAQAELNNVSAENSDAFEEFRVEVSRNLKKLVSDLPDPVEPEDD